jgi:hypothetical protein
VVLTRGRLGSGGVRGMGYLGGSQRYMERIAVKHVATLLSSTSQNECGFEGRW